MQNAIIKYKIRLNKPPHEGKEIEVNITLDQIEHDVALWESMLDYYPEMGWSIEYYTVIERTIEPFNED